MNLIAVKRHFLINCWIVISTHYCEWYFLHTNWLDLLCKLSSLKNNRIVWPLLLYFWINVFHGHFSGRLIPVNRDGFFYFEWHIKHSIIREKKPEAGLRVTKILLNLWPYMSTFRCLDELIWKRDMSGFTQKIRGGYKASSVTFFCIVRISYSWSTRTTEVM